MNKDRPLTRLQERLIKKLGTYAFPFYFEVPPHCPASVSLQPAPGDTGIDDILPAPISFSFVLFCFREHKLPISIRANGNFTRKLKCVSILFFVCVRTGKPCGVDYELKAFVGDHIEDKPHKRNSVRLAIRKIMYAPSKLGEQPSIEVSKEFMLKPNKIHLEASLDKEVTNQTYYEQFVLLSIVRFFSLSPSICFFFTLIDLFMRSKIAILNENETP